MARRTRSRAAARQGLARTRTHSADSETAASRLGRAQYRRRLRLEALEDRRLLAGITVTTLADTVDFNDGVTSLREAIFAANTVPGADTIDFAPALTANGPATILLTQGELKITDSLTINGPGAGLLTIDASGNDPTPELNNRDGSRIFNTMPSTRPAPGQQLPSLHVEGLTLTGGDVNGNGGAILSAGVLALVGCTVKGNASRLGGGVALGTSQIYAWNQIDGSGFYNCEFIGNSSAVDGGGVFVYGDSGNESAKLVVSQCNFEGNTALGKGGGLSFTANVAGAEINHSVFRGNSAENGGGISAGSKGEIRIVRSAVIGNVSVDTGGGIAGGQNLTIDSSTIAQNSAGRLGGGVWNVGTAIVENSTISGNRVRSAGATWNASGVGGIGSTTKLILRHSTVTRNTVGANFPSVEFALGGGVFSQSITMDHAIVAGNTRGVLAKPDDAHGNAMLSDSLLGVSAGAVIIEIGRNLVGTLESPIDPLLGPLTDNGGFELPDGVRILTHALLPGSPAINAGDLNAVAGEEGVPEFDQRGEPFGRNVGGRMDIGAFEYQTPTDLKLLVDTLVDESDGDYSRGDLSLREAIELANATKFAGVVDTIRFDSALWAAGPATILLTMIAPVPGTPGAPNRSALAVTDSLTIIGPGAELLTLDASGNDPTPNVDDGKGSRVFVVGSGGELEVRFVGLTLTGGDVSSSGGAILNSTGLTIRDCVISDNSASNGGGVASSTFTTGVGLRILNSRVTGNRALFGGGGVSVTLAGFTGLEVAGSTISGNQAKAGNGGGIYVSGNRSSISIQSSVISGNHGGRDGGGAWFGHSLISPITISDSTFADNVAMRIGGGIYNQAELSIRNTIISGNSARNGGGIETRARSPVTIAESTISGNVASAPLSSGYGYGGGIAHLSPGGGAVLMVVGSTIHENSATRDGGGISTRGGQTQIIDSRFEVNHAENNGGGIQGLHSQITVSSSTMAANTSGVDGGGIYARTGRVELDHVVVIANEAGRDAGGLNVGRLAMVTSTIQDNTAARDGGGLVAGGTIDRSTIAGNSAGRNGGGFHGAVLVTDSTFSGNHAIDTGGGLWITGDSTLAHATVTANTAKVAGGGLFASAGSVTIVNTIVAANEGLLGSDFTGLSGSNFAVHFSLIGSNKNTGLAQVPIGTTDANGNIIGGSGSGVDPLLGPLSDNGGPTRTHALLPGSPAINAGDPLAVAGVNGVPVHDQRGAPFTRVFGGRIDMGAVEAIPVGVLPGDYNDNGVVDAADYSVWRDAVGSANDWRADGNGDGKVDALDYELWKANFGATEAQVVGSRVRRDGVALSQVLPPAEPGAGGRVGDAIVDGATERSERGMQRFASRRMTEVIDTRRERLLDAWWAMRDRVFNGVADVDARTAGNKPVAVEAVDFAVMQLGRLRLGVGE